MKREGGNRRFNERRFHKKSRPGDRSYQDLHLSPAKAWERGVSGFLHTFDNPRSPSI